jgi:predicted RNA-binding protein YlqC (UPF0109 family)
VHELANLLEVWLRLLVKAPEQVRVRIHDRDPSRPTRLIVSVSPEDRGYVFGKRGRTIAALRTVVDAVARRRGLRCRLEVVE